MKNRPDNIRSKKYLILSGKKLTDNIRKKNNPIFIKIYLIPITGLNPLDKQPPPRHRDSAVYVHNIREYCQPWNT